MTPKQRWTILGSLLAATLLAAWWVDDEPLPDKKPRQRSAARPLAAATAPVALVGAAPEQGRANGSATTLAFAGVDPFRDKSWYVAPPPPKPSKPKAPPLPFQYLGKVIEDGEIKVFLNQMGKHLIVKEGDVIDGTYRVEQIANGQIELLYQPLQERQTLSIGSLP